MLMLSRAFLTSSGHLALGARTVGREASLICPTAVSADVARMQNRKQMSSGAVKVKAKAKDGKQEEKKAKGKAAAPKRPLSAYSMYMKSVYTEMKVKYPDMSFTAISRKVADMWRELPDEHKVKFLREAEKAMIKAKADKPPSRPPNAYALFAKENYKVVKQKYPDMSFPDVSKMLGQMWRQLPPLEKAARMERAAKKRKEFNEAANRKKM